MKRPLAALILALSSALLLAGCGEAPEEALRFGLSSAPVRLDPRFATDAASERIGRLLYARLVEFDEAARPIPGIARWERLAPDRYRFTLDPTRRPFHDGRPVTAADVEATYRFVLDPAHASPHRLNLLDIEHIERLDAERLEFRLKRPDPLFPAKATLGIVPADAPPEGVPTGSGPFAFVRRPEEGRVRLRRRRDGLALEFVTVKEPTVRVLKLLRGEIDLLQNDLPPELADYLEGADGVRVVRRPGNNFSYLGFNLEDPLTGRPEVRRAVALAIDREAILGHLLPGARPAAALLPPEHWAGAPGLAPPGYDPAEARRLLREAGFGPENPLRLGYKTSADPFRVRLATLLQHQFKQVGIELKVRSYDWGAFFGDIKGGRFQLYSLSWVGVKSPDLFRYIFHRESLPPRGANRGRYKSAEADRLIEAAERAESPDERAALYRRLQGVLLADLPYVPLWYEAQFVAHHDRVRGYRPAADGNYDALEQVVIHR